MYRIEITGVGSELQGVGRLPDGRAAFVPGAIPGETVDIEITADKGRFCEASLVSVVKASPDRAIPGCPHADRCGGCQARHMTYARTLALKRQKVIDALERIGGLPSPTVFEALGCDRPDRTRNKAEYPIAIQEGRPVIGAYARGSHRVIPLTDCLSQPEESVAALLALSELLPGLPAAGHLRFLVTRVNRKGELMAVLSGDAPILSDMRALAPRLRAALPGLQSLWYCQLNRRPAHALDGRCIRIFGGNTLTMSLFDLRFELSPQAFFQVNAPQAERLYEKALEAAGVLPGGDRSVLDAYCGAGTISLCAARRGARVTGVEIVPQAIENARRNAQINGLSGQSHFICADAAQAIPQLLNRGEYFDAVILDPPRKGADEALLAAIARAPIPTVSYVSCNPATLARDAKYLCVNGYRLKWAQPVDMFPWTGHVETVALMSRK